MEELQSYLNTRILGHTMKYERSVFSTQTLAHEWAIQGASEGSVIIADTQSNGRGRSGKQWCSPVGTGIWMSLILRPNIPLKNATHFTLLTSVAVQKGIQTIVDLSIQIKWPNDLLINGKKTCGILTEVRSRSNQLLYMVIGVGINVNTLPGEFPHELRDKVTSLGIECGKKVSRPLLVASILQEMECYYLAYRERGFEYIRQEWEACSGILGKSVTAQAPHGRVTGKALELTDKGELIIQTKYGKCAINSPYIELL